MAIKILITSPLPQPINGFEFHPCKIINYSKFNGKEIAEQCEEGEEDFWSVYAHLKEGGLECIADCSTKEEANELKTLLVCYQLSAKIDGFLS